MNNNFISMTQTSSSTSGFASEVLRLVNRERARNGLAAYTTTQPLTAAANQRAKEIVTRFSHTRPDGSRFFTVLRQYGIPFRAAGENIASGQRTPQEVVNAWMNSPGHRRNILNSTFKKIGIGVTQQGNQYFWEQIFTN